MAVGEPYLIHIDSSRSQCSIALSQGPECIYQKVDPGTYRHAQQLPLLIQEALDDTGIKLDSLSALHFCIGPGSYTALRVSVALAKSLSLVLPIRLIASSTFRVAQFISGLNDSVVLVTQYARKDEVYVCVLNEEGSYEIEPTSMKAQYENLRALSLQYQAQWVHIGKSEIGSIGSDVHVISDFTAYEMIDLGYTSFMTRNFINKYDIVPLYIKPPHITTPRRVLPRR